MNRRESRCGLRTSVYRQVWTVSFKTPPPPPFLPHRNASAPPHYTTLLGTLALLNQIVPSFPLGLLPRATLDFTTVARVCGGPCSSPRTRRGPGEWRVQGRTCVPWPRKRKLSEGIHFWINVLFSFFASKLLQMSIFQFISLRNKSGNRRGHSMNFCRFKSYIHKVVDFFSE